MATSRSFIKCLKSTCEIGVLCIFLTVSGGWISATYLWNKQFPEVLYKRDVLKNFSKPTDKHNKQPSAGILSRDVLKYFGIFTEKVIFRSFSFNKVVGWKSETVRSSYLRFSVKKLVLKNFANFTVLKPYSFIKNTPTQMPSCKISQIFKKSYFEEHLWTTTCKLYLKRDSNTGVFLLILWITQE